jgi:putative flippase GtrA
MRNLKAGRLQVGSAGCSTKRAMREPRSKECIAASVGRSRAVVRRWSERRRSFLCERRRRRWVPKRDRASSSKLSGYCLTVVERLKHYLLVRHRRNWEQLFRFGLVGASGVFVNLFVAIMCKKIGPDEDGIFFDLPLTDFNVRWYHVYSTIAFLVANLWNFELNRLWTFRSAKHAGWFREYFPFLTVGILAQTIGLGILTLLMHPDSVFSLSPTFFDDSTGFRTRFYWAQLITIAIVTPVSFLLNKFWTFSAVRGKHRVDATEEETVESGHPTAGI